MGKHGLTVDNLISADVVTADGHFRTASLTDAPDLFWALRGGGGNFGVVTSFEYRLHPVTQVLGGLVIYPLEQAREVLRFYRDFCRALPDEAEAYAGLLTTRDDVVQAVAHPCHPSIFLQRQSPAEWADTFGGIAAPQDAIAAVESVAREVGPEGMVLVNLSGRGDKDVQSIQHLLGEQA